MWSMFLLIFLMLCVGFAGWMFFLWAVKRGGTMISKDRSTGCLRMREKKKKEKKIDLPPLESVYLTASIPDIFCSSKDCSRAGR